MPGRPRGPPGKLGGIDEHQADDLPKAQGDNGQIVSPQPQGGQAQDQAEEGGHQGAGQNGQPEGDPQPEHQQAPGIGADPVEGHVAEGKLPRVAGDQVQAQGQDAVEAHGDQDVDIVFIGDHPGQAQQ